MTTTRNITLRTLLVVVLFILAGAQRSHAQGVGISETSITPDPSAILELQSTTRGFLLPRPTSTPGAVIGMMFYDPAANQINYRDDSAWRIIPSALSKLSFFGSTTSAELAGVISDETGSGLLVFATAPVFATTVTIGTLTGTTGAIDLVGTTSGTVTVKPQDAAGTYNFNLPTTAGSAGQPLLSGGGIAAPMTFGTLGIGAGGTGQTTQTPAFDALAPTTTAGDLIYHNGTDNARLAPGSAFRHLRMNSAGNAPEWADDWIVVRRTEDTTKLTNTLVNLGNMEFSVTSGSVYTFKFTLIYFSSTVGVGLRTTITVPGGTLAAQASHYGHAVDGVGTPWAGNIISSGDVVVSTGIAAIGVANSYLAIVEGTFVATGNGNLVLQWAPETNNAVTIRANSVMMYRAIP